MWMWCVWSMRRTECGKSLGKKKKIVQVTLYETVGTQQQVLSGYRWKAAHIYLVFPLYLLLWLYLLCMHPKWWETYLNCWLFFAESISRRLWAIKHLPYLSLLEGSLAGQIGSISHVKSGGVLFEHNFYSILMSRLYPTPIRSESLGLGTKCECF